MSEQTSQAERAGEFSFCEPSSATTRSKEHIRLVGPEGRKLGGGVPTPALCGYDLRSGWDLAGPVTAKRFTPDWDLNPTCRECIAAWEAATQPTPSEGGPR